MNKPLLVSISAAIFCCPALIFGQTPAPAVSGTSVVAATPPPTVVSTPPVGGIYVTPEERQTLIETSRMAITNPKVQAAKAKLQAAMKAAHGAMVAKDSTLGPLLDKIEASGTTGGPPPPLTDAEKARLGAARKAIVGTPEADAWQKATMDYRAAMRSAMIQQNPAVRPILEKIEGGPMRPIIAGSSGSPAAVKPVFSVVTPALSATSTNPKP